MSEALGPLLPAQFLSALSPCPAPAGLAPLAPAGLFAARMKRDIETREWRLPGVLLSVASRKLRNNGALFWPRSDLVL